MMNCLLRFRQGFWSGLYDEAVEAISLPAQPRHVPDTQGILARAEGLAKRGNLTKSLQSLQATPVSPASPEVLAALAARHPQALQPLPEGVGECLLRIVAKAALFLNGAAARAHLAPLQFGVAEAGGIEAAIHMARTYLEENPGSVALQIDLANAFNAVERAVVFEGLKNDALESLVPLVRLSYGTPSTLQLDHDFGVAPLLSARGVRQGDPLGPLLFAASIHPCLTATASAHPRVVILAYADDITLLGKAEACTEAFLHLTAALLRIGLEHNLGKCEAWSAAAIDPSTLPLSFPIAADGLRVLGSPIGTLAGCASRVRERLAAAAEPLPLLSQMDPQLCLLLLTRCVGRRASFLARTTPLAVLPEDEWSAWGEQLLNTFLDAAHIATPRSDAERRRIWRQAALPVTLGGLGITNPAVEGSYAYLASVVGTSHLLRSLADTLHPDVAALLPLMDPTSGSMHALPARLAAAEAAPPPEALEALQAGKADPQGLNLQQSLALAVQTRRFLRVMNEARRMPPSPLSGHAQRMQSLLGPGAGDWLLVLPIIPSLGMGPSQLSSAATFRLGLPLPVPRRCDCRYRTKFPDDRLPNHLMRCKKGGGEDFYSPRTPGRYSLDSGRSGLHDKEQKYARRNVWVGFHALAVETYGYPSPGVMVFLRQCAELAAKLRFNAAPTSYEAAKLLTEYRQRWSVCLQRAQANALRCKTNKALAADELGMRGPFAPLSEGQLYQLIEPPFDH
ncbi:unnamed protein product [Closterium sp. NIES-54]